ncbi:MAG: T9SS type A sorting domain-containing protein [Ekhidna sp.]
MKKIIGILVFLLTTQISFTQTTTQDGDWITGATWGGSSPGYTGLTNPTVAHEVESASGLTFANSNGLNLTVSAGGTLIVRGDIIFNVTKNNAGLFVNSGATLIVFGSVELGKNNSGITVAAGGVVVVTEDISAAGNTGTISGEGLVYTPSTNLNDGGIGEGTVQPIDNLDGDGYVDIENFVDGNGSDPLPVKLVDFSAEVESSIQLSWSTATEINNDHFVIERSEDGHYFYEIDKVEGNGNSNEIIKYSYNDNFPASEIEFYRLKQVDYNGDFERFNTIRVENTNNIKKSEVTIYPSVVNDQYFSMRSNAAFEPKEVILYNLKGGTVYQLTENAEKVNPMNYRVNTDGLEKGIYFLNMTSTTGDTKSTRLIIK